MEMESRDKLRVVLGIACLAAAAAAITYYGTRKRRSKHGQTRVSCYLQAENKPQKSFKRVLADNSYGPFKHFGRDGRVKEDSEELHPYEKEITFLLENPPTPPSYGGVNSQLNIGSSYVWVTTRSQLEELALLLAKEQVFAVDTEQHSLRSFLGFTALMQISTQKEDYLLDTIALHDDMDILRPVFADPSICKVFHGADNDVLWLQRDFHIYVINLFDTAKACDVLSKPYRSLAYLLEAYCGKTANKMLQLEDWRQRPLSAEMIEYACGDAHYLIYIADCLVKELKTKSTENSSFPGDKCNFLLEACRRSNAISLQLYMKDTEFCLGDSVASSIVSRYLSNCEKDTSSPTSDIFQVRKLCTWRDLMARAHDESLRYVLSEPAIVALATRVPKSPQEIYDIIVEADSNSDPANIGFPSQSSPSLVVCSHLADLCCLFEEDMDNSIDLFERILQKHLGPSGTCPLSIYNYAILSRYNSKVVNMPLKQNGGKPTKRVDRKASRKLFVQKFSCKAPVYHNCRIYASDGRLLCYCDRRKLEWYLRRDLAKLVDDDSPAIMLLFEPKGRPEDEDNDFYIQSKKNMCVGCGERNHYLRYRIVPSCYRLHFPEHLKSHRSHDIVLVCVDCHEIAHAAAEKYKRHVAKEFDIPLFVSKVADSGQNQVTGETSRLMGKLAEAGVSPLQLRTAAVALLRHGMRMPQNRREELTEVVRAYFGRRDISDEDLERALLGGMSPQERRRLEKKRGLSLKNSMGAATVTESTESDRKASEGNLPGSTAYDVRHTSSVSDMKVASMNGHSITSDLVEDVDKSLSPKKESVGALNTSNGDSCNSRKPSDNSLERSSECNSKLSLLGHGPHGKQVVERILKEYGEEGIRQFCQRWRQVFVEAINPRFLPAGWDIKHSGRRDFGDYSVYNPSKKSIVQGEELH
ncbi:protein RRP6-like 3 isoform X2 [Aristolochia californica]|uniref:protein RRP6-like 3 isoform X2 n=1 Tax=Aristolochia californica TaxID=171875 RepID=UPI0035D90EBE